MTVLLQMRQLLKNATILLQNVRYNAYKAIEETEASLQRCS